MWCYLSEKRTKFGNSQDEKELLNDVSNPSLQQQNKLLPVKLDDKGQNTLTSKARK